MHDIVESTRRGGVEACLDQDPELFFPIGESETYSLQINAAKAVCGRCPERVRARCLDRAMDNGYAGIWGGTTERERRRLRRRAAARAKAVPA